MEALMVILAFFFALLMCLGIILMKWIISQIGATVFFLILFLMVAMFMLAMGGHEDYDDEE